MNILPLVFSFLLIFALLNQQLMRNTLSFFTEKNNFIEHQIAKQAITNKAESLKYNHLNKKETPASSSTSTTQPCLVSHRFNVRRTIKWNLFAQIHASKQNSSLETACSLFLESLYGHTIFWQESLKQKPDLAKQLVSFFTEQKNAQNLFELMPQDPILQKVFYKMLKGSSSYNLEKKEGHPPLEDFFSFDTESKIVLHIPRASFYALQALLGQEITKQILSLEKELKEKKGKTCSITKTALSSLLQTQDCPIRMEDLSTFVRFDHANAPPKKIHCQNKTIFIQIPVN